MDIAEPLRRTRPQLFACAPDARTNRVRIDVPVDVTELAGKPPVSIKVMVEQSADGSLWWPLGGFGVADIAAKLATRNKRGELNTLYVRLTEQTYRGDAYKDLRFDREGGGSSWDILNPDDGALYHQLALCRYMRVHVDTYFANEKGEKIDHAPLFYKVEANWDLASKPPPKIARRSMSLLGTFSAAESAGATTTGSRTTTTGSLITGSASFWQNSNPAAGALAACTDNQSNTFTEPTNGEVEFSSGASSFGVCGLSYNLAGNRAAGHTVSHSDQGNNALGAQEWDGIDAGPTVTSDAGSTGSGTAVSDSPGTLPAAAGVLLVHGYDGSATTFAPNGTSSAQEIDENNDQQAHAVYYLVAQTGNPSLAATLAASRTWGAIAIGFQETAGGGGTTTPKNPLYFPLHGPFGGRV